MIVISSGKHLLALINDIIDLSMIETGRIRAVVCEFNLKQIVDEAATNLNVILNEKNLECKVDVRAIKMKSDRTRILQCIMNLLSNAIKYTEKGRIKITAKVIDNNVELSVTDTGIGIKTEDIPKLFVRQIAVAADFKDIRHRAWAVPCKETCKRFPWWRCGSEKRVREG